MKPRPVLIYSLPTASIGLITAVAIFLYSISRISAKSITDISLFAPLLIVCVSVLIYQLLSWYELTPNGITRRRLYFLKSSYSWEHLHKFCLFRWKGTSTFQLFFNGFEKQVSIPGISSNINQLHFFINTSPARSNLLFNDQGKQWLSNPAA